MSRSLKTKFFIGALLFLVSFLAYLKTLCPTVYWYDSGELISVCYTLGIAHPTGYPLYALLGRLFTLIPIGDVAYRVNLMSAFFASLTVVLTYLILLSLFTRHIPALIASLCLAFSFTLWSYALIAEATTLLSFFILLLTFLLLKWREGDDERYLWLFAFLFGLGLGNHITIAIFLPLFLVFILVTNYRTLFNIRNSLLLLLFFLCGLSVYAYLPLRSLQNPMLDWGNPENLTNFLRHFTGEQYRWRLLSGESVSLSSLLKDYLSSLGKEYLFLSLFSLFGIFYLFKKDLRGFLLLLGLLLSNLLFSLSTRLSPLHYFLPSFLIIALWMGGGIDYLLEKWLSLFSHKKRIVYLSYLLLFSLPCFLFTSHYSQVNQSNNFQALDYGRSLLPWVKEKAVIITRDTDITFLTWYFQSAEDMRRDVTVISTNLLASSWYRGTYFRDRALDLNFIPFYKRGEKSRDEWTEYAIHYMVSHNLRNYPHYISFGNPIEGYSLIPGYYAMSKGTMYEIRKEGPRLVKRPGIQHPAEINFGNKIFFLGYDLEKEEIRPGETFPITYYWKILGDEDYRVQLVFTDERGDFNENEKGLPSIRHFYRLSFPQEKGSIIRIDSDVFLPRSTPCGDYYLQLACGREGKEEFLRITGSEERFARIGRVEVKGR